MDRRPLYAPHVITSDVVTRRWELDPDAHRLHRESRTRPRRYFAYDAVAALRAAYDAAEALGHRPRVSLHTRVVPGNGRSPRSYPQWVHVSWLSHDLADVDGATSAYPRPGSPEAAEEARLDAEWGAGQAAETKGGDHADLA